MQKLIEMTNLHKYYTMGDSVVKALDGVSVSIDQGEFVAIMGPSGSGKSTLMHLIGLLDVPDSGQFNLGLRDIAKASDDELAVLRSETIGFVFQQFNLLPRTSARENVALPMLYSQERINWDRVDLLLEKVGLGKRTDHHPNQLSGGQQQRVAIARALVNRPSLILADEPTGNLDSKSQHEIMELLRQLNAEGITIILVTHEEEVASYVKRVITMRDGKITSSNATLSPLRQELERSKGPACESHDEPGIPTLSNRPTSHYTDNSPLHSKTNPRSSPWEKHFSYWQQAFRSIVSNKVRSALSMLGILIGVAAVIAMLALGTGAQDSIKEQLSNLGSNLLIVRTAGSRVSGVSSGAGAVSRLRLEDAVAIRNSLENVSKVSASLTNRAQIAFGGRNWNGQVFGVDASYTEMHAATPLFGRPMTEQEVQQRARVAMVGTTVVRELFEERNPVGEMIKINRTNFQIIGVLPVRGSTSFMDRDDVVLIPVTTAMYRVFGKPYIESIEIEVVNQQSMAQVEDDAERLLRDRLRISEKMESPFNIRNMADIQDAISSTSRIMSALLACIASISLIVGGIGIMNIMLVSVSERTREIGLRKAIGARKSSIKIQFLVEAVVISTIGGLFGISLGVMASVGVAEFLAWPSRITPMSIGLSAVFSVGVGICFGFWPAAKAASLHPIQALRHD